MIDFELARRFLMKVQKDILRAQQTNDIEEVKKHLRKANGELDLMYDILHLHDLDVIDPNRVINI